MAYFTTITEKAQSLVAQSPLAHRSRLLLAALPAALIALLLPAYRDYQSWLLLGPGGPPYNVFGWLLVKLLFDPLRREPFGTVLYDGKIESGEQAAFLSSLPHRRGQRPTMGEFTVPQRQMSQRPSAEIRDKLMAAYGAFLERNAHIVDRVPSILERHTDAAHVCGHVPLTSVARQMKREICHVHGTSDYSLHVTLAPADCKRVIESGWGQRFPLAGSSVFRNVTFGRISTIPTEYVLIYAPRDEEEIKVAIGILKAGVQYVTGLSDVK